MDLINDFFLSNIWAVHLVHLLFAILLFFIMNWIGRHSMSLGYMQLSVAYREDSAPAFNFVFKIIGPVVYLILCGVFFQTVKLDSLVDNCYFIVIYYWAFRLLWNIVFNRLPLTDWFRLIIYWISSIGLAYWIYTNIEKVETILPDGKGLIDQMWILIIAFLYALFNNLRIGESQSIKRKDKYLKSRYEKFMAEYGSIIHTYFNNPFYEALTYSIMIFENFNRPPVVRAIEYVSFFITRKRHTLGIMQITTDRYISDKESVRLAVKKIAEDNNAYIRNQRESGNQIESGNEIYQYDLISYIANQYNGGNPDYSSEIIAIYDDISKRFYGDIGNEFIDIIHG